jgi:prepilin-type N-terminal cleavage/methylation domain-containing protein
MTIQQQKRGVSLVEILVAITILLIGILPLLRLMVFSLRTGNRAHVTSVATNLARGMGEEIRMKAFSEEFTIEFEEAGGDPDLYYPNTTTPQSFGLEAGETAFNVGDPRFLLFDDVDDYNNWCRGRECDCTGIVPAALCDTSPLETHDGHPLNGTNGYPDYTRYTRRVRVFNATVDDYYTYRRAPYENLSTVELSIHRYNFEESNYSNLTTNATGRSPLKLIEVTISYRGAEGIAREDLQIKDVSMAVMPLLAIQED